MSQGHKERTHNTTRTATLDIFIIVPEEGEDRVRLVLGQDP
jgi:hypothetical protein